jgi:Fusaric acid resistance protein-like
LGRVVRLSETEHAEAPKSEVDVGQPSRGQRWLHILGTALVGVVLPALLLGALVGELGVWAFLVGLLLGVVGCKLGGTRRMVVIAPLLGLAAGLGAFTAYDWWWAALLAGTGILTGAGIGFGWFGPLLMVPYAATFIVPVSSGTDAVIYGVIVAIATLYAVVIMRRFSAPEIVPGQRLSVPIAAAVAIVFGLVLGASAAIGVALGWTEPYWVPEPVLILVLYILMGKRDRIRGKALGTALGIAAAIPVALLDPPAEVLAVVGAVAFVLALTQAKTYWLMYGLYTFSLVLLLAAPGQVGFEAEERGFQILVGVGLLVVGLFLVHALGSWLSKRHPQPELAPAV